MRQWKYKRVSCSWDVFSEIYLHNFPSFKEKIVFHFEILYSSYNCSGFKLGEPIKNNFVAFKYGNKNVIYQSTANMFAENSRGKLFFIFLEQKKRSSLNNISTIFGKSSSWTWFWFKRKLISSTITWRAWMFLLILQKAGNCCCVVQMWKIGLLGNKQTIYVFIFIQILRSFSL